jgi:hypothetical protein
MKNLLLLLNFILIVNYTYSQTWQWAARGGGSDGDGSSNVSEDEKIKDMVVDELGNIYVTGRIRSNSNINGTALTTYGGYDIFLAKFNCAGKLIWERTAGGNQDDESLYLALSNDSHIYITGRARSSPVNTFTIGDTSITETTSDFFIAKYDTSGNFIWIRIAAPGSSSLNSNSYGVGIDLQNNIRALMYSSQSGLFAPGYTVNSQKSYIITYNSSGNILSMDSLGDFQMPFNYDQSKSIFLPNGDFYLSGTFSNPITLNGITYTPQGSSDLIVIKYHSDATLAWVYTQGYTGSAAHVKGMEIDSQGNVFITGSLTNGYVFGSDTMQNLLAAAGFPFIAKINSSGQSLWGRTISTQYSSRGLGVGLDNNGNIFSSIQLTGDGLFGNQTIPAGNTAKIVLTKLDSGGSFQFAEMLNSTGGVEDQFTVLKPDNAGNIYLGGSFKGTVTINGNTTSSAGGKTDFLLVKHGMASCVVGIEELSFINHNYGIHAYPNPSQGKFIIRLEKYIPNFQPDQNNMVSVYNNIGQLIKEEKIEFPGIAEIDISGTPAGIYHVRAFNGERYVSTKVVISE